MRITVDIFEAGDIVDVTGTSKGKGFQGVIKRHGQSRGPMAPTFIVATIVQLNGTCSALTVFSKTNTWQDVWVATV